MSMYYGDLPETWSSFSLLYEQETVSWKEEEKEEQRMKRIFDNFPRRRSWLKKPLQNLNGASSSTSSSSLLVNCNMAETEDTDTTNPQNPRSQSSSSSCLTENTTRRKRRAVQEGKRSFKKAKVSPLFSWEGKDTPDWMVQLMRSMKGGGEDPKLIFEKTLFETDVKPSQSRLSIPFHKLIRNDFLTAAESRIIEEDIDNREKMGLGALLVDQGIKKWGVFLKRWEMNGSWNYALVCGWNDVVSISLWSFRCRGVLCFALVPLPMSE